MKAKFFLFLVSASFTASATCFASPLSADDSKTISRLIEGRTEKVDLVIRGFVTERANPPIDYGHAFLRMAPPADDIILENTGVDLQPIPEILKAAGGFENVYSGGTTYVESEADIQCLAFDSCLVIERPSR